MVRKIDDFVITTFWYFCDDNPSKALEYIGGVFKILKGENFKCEHSDVNICLTSFSGLNSEREKENRYRQKRREGGKNGKT